MAELITSIAALVSAILMPYALWRISLVRKDVQTANGLTMAALADRAEGRRIADDIAQDDRTHSEQEYVTRLYDQDVEEG